MHPNPLSLVLVAAAALAGCSTFKPPQISYDDPPEPAVLETDPPKSVQVVEVPKLLPLPGQLKPLPGPRAAPEPRDPRQRVDLANAAARIQPSRSGYLNAVQVYPFAEGALYQVYSAPGEITDIALQQGEDLVGSTTKWSCVPWFARPPRTLGRLQFRLKKLSKSMSRRSRFSCLETRMQWTPQSAI
jgi:hypothetical protein